LSKRRRRLWPRTCLQACLPLPSALPMAGPCRYHRRISCRRRWDACPWRSRQVRQRSNSATGSATKRIWRRAAAWKPSCSTAVMCGGASFSSSRRTVWRSSTNRPDIPCRPSPCSDKLASRPPSCSFWTVPAA
jgi:hypothetical protein